MTVPTIISANVSPTHRGADSRGCIVGPPTASASKREPGRRARTITRHLGNSEVWRSLAKRDNPAKLKGLPNFICAKSRIAPQGLFGLSKLRRQRDGSF